MMGVHHGYPEWGIGPKTPDEKVSEWMWPIIKGMVIDLLEIEHNYILEGTYLLPNNLNQLSSEFSKSVRAYPKTSHLRQQMMAHAKASSAK